jgi:hypothetical protein
MQHYCYALHLRSGGVGGGGVKDLEVVLDWDSNSRLLILF